MVKIVELEGGGGDLRAIRVVDSQINGKFWPCRPSAAVVSVEQHV